MGDKSPRKQNKGKKLTTKEKQAKKKSKNEVTQGFATPAAKVVGTKASKGRP